MPEFTVDWFSGHIPNWEKWLSKLKGQPCELLEIGCFEGRSTLWLLENIMAHPSSHIYCIDSFQGGDEHHGYDFQSIKRRFETNTAPYSDKVTLIVGLSHGALRNGFKPLDFAYLDGSHRADDVYMDGVLAWPLLKPGAIMIFDDYEWDGCPPNEPNTKSGIDRFLATIAGRYQTVARSYQLAIRKQA